MFFEKLETEVKDKLAASLGAGVEVELEPETEAQNVRPFAKPRVSVLFDQSDFEKQNGTQYISQHETGRLAIIIRSRTLRGTTGIYNVAENVRKSIAGFAPSDWSKIWLIKFLFLEREDGVWKYALIIGSKSLVVEEATLETGPNLNSATATYTDTSYN